MNVVDDLWPLWITLWLLAEIRCWLTNLLAREMHEFIRDLSSPTSSTSTDQP